MLDITKSERDLQLAVIIVDYWFALSGIIFVIRGVMYLGLYRLRYGADAQTLDSDCPGSA